MPTLVFETRSAPARAGVGVPRRRRRGPAGAVAPAARVKIESADLPVRRGSRIVITARGPLGFRLRWVADRRAHAARGWPRGRSARFADEQESGPFKSWRHEHTFTGIDEDSTRLTDRVTYTDRFGPLGRLADRLFVRRQVEAMFRHRHEACRACSRRGRAAGKVVGMSRQFRTPVVAALLMVVAALALAADAPPATTRADESLAAYFRAETDALAAAASPT